MIKDLYYPKFNIVAIEMEKNRTNKEIGKKKVLTARLFDLII